MQASLKQLRYFIVIAECGKVSEAAKRLHISQPALSAALAQLEEIWDTQLFVRHKAQGVSLTANGARLLPHSRQLLQQAGSLDDYARELTDQVRGEIHIGCFSTLAPFWVPKLLQLASETYPELDISVTESDLIQLDHQLRAGQLELALSYGIERSEQIAHESLAQSDPYVLLPVNHPLTQYNSLTLEQLADESMVLLNLPHSREYFTRLFEQINRVPRIAYRSTNFEMVRCMVAAGLGYSLLNQQPQHNLTYNGHEVRTIPLTLKTPCSLEVVIASQSKLKPSIRAEAVINLIKQIAEQDKSALKRLT